MHMTQPSLTNDTYVEVAKRLYPPDKDGKFDRWAYYDYDSILEYLGNAVVTEFIGNYQGDALVLFKGEDNKWGYLSFGWGSCSGCDALQSCSDYEELGALIKWLEYGINWFSREETLKWFNEHDWKGDFCWSQDKEKVEVFVQRCKLVLEAV